MIRSNIYKYRVTLISLQFQLFSTKLYKIYWLSSKRKRKNFAYGKKKHKQSNKHGQLKLTNPIWLHTLLTYGTMNGDDLDDLQNNRLSAMW